MTLTVTQNVTEVNITATQSGISVTLQPVIVLGGAGGGGAVTSVNGQIGVVLLETDNISDVGEVNKYTTQADIDRLVNTSGTNTGDQTLPTNTSDLINDGANGINPFITAADVPADAVTSVNGQVGIVVLDTDDIADTATNRYTNDTDVTRLVNTSGTNTGDQDISGIGTNATAITTLQGNRLLEVQAGTNVTVNNADPLRPIVSATGGGVSPLTTKGDLYTYSTDDDRLPIGANGQVLSANSATSTGLEWVAGGGGATKLKDYIQITGNLSMGGVNNWYTFGGVNGWNQEAINQARGNGTSPNTDYQDFGITIPQGYKVNKVVVYITRGAPASVTDYGICFNKKIYNLGNDDYESAFNPQYDFTELYNDLYFNNSALPVFTINNTANKRTFVMPTGLNEFSLQDGQLIPYFRPLGAFATNVSYTLIAEIEEI